MHSITSIVERKSLLSIGRIFDSVYLSKHKNLIKFTPITVYCMIQILYVFLGTMINKEYGAYEIVIIQTIEVISCTYPVHIFVPFLYRLLWVLLTQ